MPAAQLPVEGSQLVSARTEALLQAGYALLILCYLDEMEGIFPTSTDSRMNNFAGWWNADQRSDGFGNSGRAVYCALMTHRQRTAASLAPVAGYSPFRVAVALSVLVGTGVIWQENDEHYVIGARLFEEWVKQQ